MKLITNSIDVENFQTSISHAELDGEMASCNIAKVNGQCSKDQETSDNAGMEKVAKVTKLLNGIHSKSASTKCNGKVNGFYDEASDDDYQLVLESSSEEESSKKIDDDTISAPQIVQEIEDLLGIKSITDGIDDELEKDLVVLDSTGIESVDLSEKDEGSVVNDESVNNIEQEVEEVFSVNRETDRLSDDVKESSKEEKESEFSNKISDAECDASSSNMNLVFDEVEIGDDIEEPESTTDKSNEASRENLIEKKQTSHNLETNNTEKLIKTTQIENSLKNEEEQKKIDDNVKTQEVEQKNDNAEALASATEEEVVILSQTSNSSECSAEWVVLDSVGSSEDESNYQPKPNSVNAEKNSEKSQKSNIDSKSHIENDTACSSSIVSSDEGSRKRTASIEEEKFDFKKPKLEIEKPKSCEKICPKRHSPEMNEEDVKRLKVCNSPVEEEVVEKETDDKSDIEMCVEINEKQNNSLDTENTGEVKAELEVSEGPSKDEGTTLKETNETSDSDLVSSNTDVPDAEENKCRPKDEVDKIEEEDSVDEESDSNKPVKVENSCKTEESGFNKLLDNENKCDNEVVDSSVVVEGENNCENKELELNEVEEEEKICEDEVLQSNELNSQVQDCEETSITESDNTNKTVEKDDVDLSNVKTDVPRPALSSLSKVPESTTSEVTSSDEISKHMLSSEEEISEEKLIEEENSTGVSESQSDDESKEDVGVSSTIDSSELDVATKSDSSLDDKSSEKSSKQEESPQKLDKTLNVNDDIDLVNVSENEESTQPMDLDKETSEDKDDKKSTTKTDTVVVVREEKNNQERSVRSPFMLLSKAAAEKELEPKSLTNLDKSIESVVEKARSETSRLRPLLKKFHKDQLKKMTRSELEEAVVLKICEAVTDRSEIGQLRLRCQTLEQNNDLWRKKAAQFEKQNRELEMVLKRFLAETTQIKRDNLNKMALPIKVTRSVGLQVVLASSMHGALVSSRNRLNADSSPSTSSSSTSSSSRSSQQTQHQQQQQKQQQPIVKPKFVVKEPQKEPPKASTFNTSAQSNTVPNLKRGGRPVKPNVVLRPSTSSSSSTQSTPVKATPPSTPVKPAPSPAKVINAPGKDLEVIDLTDREDRSKPPQKTPPAPVGGSIRVNPSTQLCFVQTSSPVTTTSPMAYIVQKPGQRQQYLVTTSSSPSTTRPVASNTRPAGMALPVFRSGQIIPVQSTPQVAVRTSMAARQVPQTIRLQQTQVMLKHPAPLPSAPMQSTKPNFKMPPPKPQLKIAKTNNGIMLSWSMNLNKEVSDMASYQLYAYQEGNQTPSTSLWKKVGDVKALPLPMACTLTQFIEGHKYHFAVRAVDVHGRIGPFSQPSSILLTK